MRTETKEWVRDIRYGKLEPEEREALAQQIRADALAMSKKFPRMDKRNVVSTCGLCLIGHHEDCQGCPCVMCAEMRKSLGM